MINGNMMTLDAEGLKKLVDEVMNIEGYIIDVDDHVIFGPDDHAIDAVNLETYGVTMAIEGDYWVSKLTGNKNAIPATVKVIM